MKLDLPPDLIALQLQEYCQHFEAGDKNALIQAIRFCFAQEIVAPEWVVAAFFRATNRWYSMDCKELGEAFDLTWQKGANVNAFKKRRRLKFRVLNEVNAARNRGRRVDDELFEEIGKPLGIGKTLVKQYLRVARRFLPAPTPKLGLRRKK